MATRLGKPVAREFEHDGAWYKVVISVEGIRLTPKRGRHGVELSWDDVLGHHGANHEQGVTSEVATPSTAARAAWPQLGMQDVVAADVLLLLRRATATLTEASMLIDRASELPSILAAHREPPAPTDEERSDWYIEPLLTIQQVSQLLGVSTRRVRGLPLRAINLLGQIRYQPAELRRFLAAQAQSPRPVYRR